MMIYQIKVTLRNIKPAIWRRFHVKGAVSLNKLHDILQVVMGWESYHLYEFEIEGQSFGQPMEGYGDMYSDIPIKNDKKIKLEKVVTNEKSRFLYTYDMGDNWSHEIFVEKILPEEKDKRYPVCLDGKRACPPEDCGGSWGYEDLLEALEKPDDPESEDLLEWAGDYDPELFDIDKINRRLQKIK
jgi:hypothetical protein